MVMVYALALSALLAVVQSKSSTYSTLNGNCLNCINAGYDFCSVGYYGGYVDPVNSICCAGMSSVSDVCIPTWNACTWN